VNPGRDQHTRERVAWMAAPNRPHRGKESMYRRVPVEFCALSLSWRFFMKLKSITFPLETKAKLTNSKLLHVNGSRAALTWGEAPKRVGVRRDSLSLIFFWWWIHIVFHRTRTFRSLVTIILNTTDRNIYFYGDARVKNWKRFWKNRGTLLFWVMLYSRFFFDETCVYGKKNRNWKLCNVLFCFYGPVEHINEYVLKLKSGEFSSF
jgi:hypothetical protein